MHHRPPEAAAGPRFACPRTFMRLPHLQTTEDVDVATPPYDPSGITAGPAASACHEMISLAALRACRP